jgi:predicted 2-oxoglutarate/Fe(II)-dependent dioxygenase YbiX/peroxiredoxin
MASSSYISLQPGDPVPWFRQRSTSNPAYTFDTVAGRHVLLCFFGSAVDPQAKAALAAVHANRALFDDVRACFFGISLDPADAAEGRVREKLPGIRFFWDFDRLISRKYGAVALEAPDDTAVTMRQFWLLLDPSLRVVSAVPFAPDGSDRDAVFDHLHRLLEPSQDMHLTVPILLLPNVFEPDLCQSLIGDFEQQGGQESGFMREVEGKTTLVHDYYHKRRKDCTVTDPALIKQVQNRVQRRIVPEILKVHHFKVTRMERYIVVCYEAEHGGHFRPHRDNTTKGTAHRRFAVSINLNEDFEGGGIGFPEYGAHEFRPPVGGAVVFSCSLLHAVSPVTKGRRFAFLPFLYDEAAAKIREANHRFLGDGYGEYKAS